MLNQLFSEKHGHAIPLIHSKNLKWKHPWWLTTASTQWRLPSSILSIHVPRLLARWTTCLSRHSRFLKIGWVCAAAGLLLPKLQTCSSVAWMHGLPPNSRSSSCCSFFRGEHLSFSPQKYYLFLSPPIFSSTTSTHNYIYTLFSFKFLKTYLLMLLACGWCG